MLLNSSFSQVFRRGHFYEPLRVFIKSGSTFTPKCVEKLKPISYEEKEVCGFSFVQSSTSSIPISDTALSLFFQIKLLTRKKQIVLKK